jgi:glycosyltransferase involved in cell wall biosynthesis
MKILYVTSETNYTGGAGIATYIAEATSALKFAGHEVHVLTWTWDDEDKDINLLESHNYILHIRRVLSATSSEAHISDYLLLSKQIATWVLKLHAQFNFDIIEGTDFGGPLYILLQSRLQYKSLNNTIITTFNHGLSYHIEKFEENFISRRTYELINMEFQCLKNADFVICPSNNAKKKLISGRWSDESKIKIISEPLRWPKERGINFEDGNYNKFLYFGRISKAKGIFEFVDFINQFSNNPNNLKEKFEIEILGKLAPSFETKDQFLARILKRMKGNLENVKIWGPVPRKDALSFISTDHISVNFSRGEAYCYAFLECILAGAIPITISDSAMAEFIPVEAHGHLTIKSHDFANFDITSTIDYYKKSGEKIREFASEISRPSRYAKAYHELLDDRVSSYKLFSTPAVSINKSFDITALVPTHNPDETIYEAINSLRNQSLKPSKIIVGDDGSYDEKSISILEKVGEIESVDVKRFDWRGLPSTRNRLLKQCETKYFAFLDSDDLYEETYIEKAIKLLESDYCIRNAINSVQSWYELFGTQRGARAPIIFEHFSHYLWNDLKNNLIGVRDKFESISYNENLTNGEAEDWEFWLRYFEAGYRINIIPEVLWRYRRHSSSMSSNWSQAQALRTSHAKGILLIDAIKKSSFIDLEQLVAEYFHIGERFYNQFPNSNSMIDSPIDSYHKDFQKIIVRLNKYFALNRKSSVTDKFLISLMRFSSRRLIRNKNSIKRH